MADTTSQTTGTTPSTVSTATSASSGINNISDARSTNSAVNLPTRAENRVIPTAVSTTTVQALINAGWKQQGRSEPPTVGSPDFNITPSTAAKRLLNDFVKIRLPHRGLNSSTSQPDPTQAVEFRFLVNPQTITINRQTVDAQSVTRGGWQFGIWGEDAFMVQLSGQSAGHYFALGTTDEFSYYAVSYRNLMQLHMLFENNGYWFEGEEFNESALAPDYLRRRIKMHQDVELHVANFIWSGMFDSLVISQDANNPFMLDFNLSFFVWKERFRSTSPYWGSIVNDVQRGNSYSAVEGTTNATQTNSTLAQYAPSGVSVQQSQVVNSLTSNPNANSPAVQSAATSNLLSTVPTNVSDTGGTTVNSCTLFPSANSNFWKGVS